MMKWTEFKEAIKSEYPKSCKFNLKKKDGSARLLYRGQGNHDWKLKTSLERAGHASMPLENYMRKCGSARRYMGNLIPSDLTFEEPKEYKYEDVQFSLPNYEYLAFLRHHGFPSILLDWSESPFIAAFFAFRQIDIKTEKVSIFGYREFKTESVTRCSSKPNLYTLGPFVSVHERHLVQQCWYTWCIKKDDGSATICPHEDGLVNANDLSNSSPDELLRWDIDASERDTVLADLFQMNITPFSLFRDIDSATETAAMRIFGL
jgi:hypothetical protein